MKNFIKLTNTDGTALYINYKTIESLSQHKDKDYTYTILATIGSEDGFYRVKESPEAILALIDVLTN